MQHIRDVHTAMAGLLRQNKLGRNMLGNVDSGFQNIRQAVSDATHGRWIKLLASRCAPLVSLPCSLASTIAFTNREWLSVIRKSVSQCHSYVEWVWAVQFVFFSKLGFYPNCNDLQAQERRQFVFLNRIMIQGKAEWRNKSLSVSHCRMPAVLQVWCSELFRSQGPCSLTKCKWRLCKKYDSVWSSAGTCSEKCMPSKSLEVFDHHIPCWSYTVFNFQYAAVSSHNEC